MNIKSQRQSPFVESGIYSIFEKKRKKDRKKTPHTHSWRASQWGKKKKEDIYNNYNGITRQTDAIDGEILVRGF